MPRSDTNPSPIPEASQTSPAAASPNAQGRSAVWRSVVARWCLLAVAVSFAAFLAAPLLAILWRALSNSALLQVISRPAVLEALRLSALTTGITLALTLLLGTPMAYLLARYRFRGQRIVDTLIELPIVLPPAVAGVGLLMAFGRRGFFGPTLESMGITIGFTTAAVIVAQLFVAAPFYIRAARSGFLAVDPELEIVSRTLGVSNWRTFWMVTVPVSLPSLFSGAVMSWARALGEFGATIMFAGSFQGRTQTMPLAIYSALETDLDASLGLSAILIVVSFSLILMLRLLVRDTEPAHA